MRWPSVKFGFFPRQWVIGAMLDYGHILPVRWVVLVFGPFTVSISAGRKA